VEQAIRVCQSVLGSSGLQPSSLDELLIAGVGAPEIRARIEEALGRSSRTDVHPEEAAALGAAMFGRSLLDRSHGKRGLAVFEVLGSPIGVMAEGGAMHKVLEQNTRLPAEKTLSVPAKAKVPISIGVFQGASPNAEEDEFLGILTATPDRDGELEIRFAVGDDGRLSVTARSPGDGSAEATFDTSAADLDTVTSRLRAASAEPPAPPRPPPRTLLGGLKRLFGR
jgi:molecular chaperone DnaK